MKFVFEDQLSSQCNLLTDPLINLSPVKKTWQKENISVLKKKWPIS
jgi:hypothetical protein